MYENVKNLDGFRVGQYFVCFPSGNFIKEDDNGNMYAEVEIYILRRNGQAEKLGKEKIKPEVEQIISEELNRLISEAIDFEKNNPSREQKNVED